MPKSPRAARMPMRALLRERIQWPKDGNTESVRSHIKLGRIGGIAVGLHLSWFIIAILIALSLAARFRAVSPGWSTAVVWSAAVLTAVLFFVTLLLHELAHSFVAKSRGLKVRAITLFALGGVSQIESDAPDAKSEFWIAIVGPLTSLIIGVIFIWAARLAAPAAGEAAMSPAVAVLFWLGYINVALAAFNMIPGYPLDGGRVLRAILWWATHSVQRATRWAAYVGQAIAFLFILFGLFRFFAGANFGGLWIALIGWFLLEAARSSSLEMTLMSGLRDKHVSDFMERDCATVPGYLSLRDFVDEYVLHSGRHCFLVTQDSHVLGLVTPNETRKVNRESWPQTSVQSVMEPVSHLPAVAPDMPAIKALELMSREHAPQLAVVQNGELRGIFSKNQLLRSILMLHGDDNR